MLKEKTKRIKFKKGEQRKFLKNVLIELNCPSLRALNQFGFEIPYSTLKNYFNESRTLPIVFFEDLCYLAKLNYDKFDIQFLESNWGQVKGGEIKKS